MSLSVVFWLNRGFDILSYVRCEMASVERVGNDASPSVWLARVKGRPSCVSGRVAFQLSR